MAPMNDMYHGASGHEDIVSIRTGWSDEHIHTELMTTEGMDRVWSFQRSLVNAMVTARRDGGGLLSHQAWRPRRS